MTANNIKKRKRVLALGDIIVRYELYPRLPIRDEDSSQSYQAIESYKASIEELPPIIVNPDNILIDGWHRWEAYKSLVEDLQDGLLDDDIKEALSKSFNPQQIEVEEWNVPVDQILFVSAGLNARGQVVMSKHEKRDVAERLSGRFSDKEIAEAIQTPERTVNRWTKDLRDRMKQRMQELVFDYADKHPEMSQTEVRTEILEKHGLEVPRSTHSDWLRDREKIEASWKVEEEAVASAPEVREARAVPDEGETTYEEYLQATTVEDEGPVPVSEPLRRDLPDATTPEEPYVCEVYKPRHEAIPKKEYLQTGCTKCGNLRTTGLSGLEITIQCGRGHQVVVTGLKRDR